MAKYELTKRQTLVLEDKEVDFLFALLGRVRVDVASEWRDIEAAIWQQLYNNIQGVDYAKVIYEPEIPALKVL